MFNVWLFEAGSLTVVVLRLWNVSQVAGSTQSGGLRFVVYCCPL